MTAGWTIAGHSWAPVWTNNLSFWNFCSRRKLLWQDPRHCKSAPGGGRNTEMGHWNPVRLGSLPRKGRGGRAAPPRGSSWARSGAFPELHTMGAPHGSSASCQLLRAPVKNGSWFLGKVLFLLHLQLGWASLRKPVLSPVHQMRSGSWQHPLGPWQCCWPVVIHILVHVWMSARLGEVNSYRSWIIFSNIWRIVNKPIKLLY